MSAQIKKILICDDPDFSEIIGFINQELSNNELFAHVYWDKYTLEMIHKRIALFRKERLLFLENNVVSCLMPDRINMTYFINLFTSFSSGIKLKNINQLKCLKNININDTIITNGKHAVFDSFNERDIAILSSVSDLDGDLFPAIYLI